MELCAGGLERTSTYLLLVLHELFLELLQVLLLQLLCQLMEQGVVDGLRHHGPAQSRHQRGQHLVNRRLR